MMKTLTRFSLAALAACLLFACNKPDVQTAPNRRVVIMYAAAFSNLSDSIAEDVRELCDGDIPFVGSGDVLLVYSHHTARGRDYNTPTSPVLFRAYRDMDGKQHRDTLAVYPSSDISSSPEVLNKVLTQVKESFPARSYGLVFSSHARGWLPVNYYDNTSSGDVWSSPASLAPMLYGPRRIGNSQRNEYPMTKWLGIEYPLESSGIDIRDLADAIPMDLDFFLMDACLMGCVEVAYELREKCKYVVFSPTEILSNGFIYTLMASRLLNVAEPDLLQICTDYMDFYNAQSGWYQAATVTMVDCSEIEPLAKACAEIIAAHPDGVAGADRNAVQHYYYNNYSDTLPWFYDLRDMMEKAGATASEMDRLDAALSSCVLYAGATPKFFDLKLERVCGLSMYLPYPDKEELNSYYKTLSWNKATGLIQ